MSTVRSAHDTDQTCECVSNHNPNPMELHRHHILPLADGGPRTPENEVRLCPTSHVNVHELYRAHVQYEGAVPWEIRKRFSPYIREVAAEGYRRLLAERT